MPRHGCHLSRKASIYVLEAGFLQAFTGSHQAILMAFIDIRTPCKHIADNYKKSGGVEKEMTPARNRSTMRKNSPRLEQEQDVAHCHRKFDKFEEKITQFRDIEQF